MKKRKPTRKDVSKNRPAEKHEDEFRLNKYLAHAGVASRRKADELISQGLVKVNGYGISNPGM